MVMETLGGKLAASAIQQVAKDSAEKSAKALETGDSPFKQMLESLDAGPEMMDLLGMNKDSSISGNSMSAISAENISVNPSEIKIGLEEPKGVEKIVDMLSEVNKGQMQMDNLVNEILYSGKRFSNQELLAIQAHVFHFAQMTELTVKVAEQGVGSVKTVLNTQIQ